MLVIGTAGHVDHGKSTLVQALTGIDPDRLEEEKRRGMTIDLGFAWLDLPSGKDASLVDVPGHERFIHTMLAGATGIDLALLVIAVDEGVMPQTREHLAILDLLGIRQGVIALTKCDLVDAEWLALVDAEVEDLVAGTQLAAAPRIPVSARTGEGLDALRNALDTAAPGAVRPDLGRPRLPVDRVFSVAGFGTVVTGTLDGGHLAVGDEVEVQPGGLRSRIRSLQRHRTAVTDAAPGTRLAVNLPGIEPAAIGRGHVLVRPGTMPTSTHLDCWLRVLPDGPALPHNQPVTVHCGAAQASGVVRVLEADELPAGRSGWVQLRLQDPLPCWPGDRLVIRANGLTVAGGTIVRTQAPRVRRRDPAVIEALILARDGDPAAHLLARVRKEQPLDQRILPPSGQQPARELQESGHVLALGEWLVTPDWLATVQARATGTLEAWHAAHPLRPGMDREALRTQLRVAARPFATILRHWQDQGAVITPTPGTVALPGHQPAPSPADGERIDAYLAALAANPFAPEPAFDLEPDLLAWLQREGRVEITGAGIVFARDAWDRVVARVRDRLARDGSVTVATIRDDLGTTRKFALAIGDHLDALHLTRREGDVRVAGPGLARRPGGPG